METAPSPHQKAGKRGCLWLAGIRDVAQPAAPAARAAVAVAKPQWVLVPALHLVCPISGHSASHQTPGVRCLSLGRVIVSPAPSACARDEKDWRRFAKGNLSFAEQKALPKLVQKCCRFHSPGLCKAAPQHNSLWQGSKGALAHVWEPGLILLLFPPKCVITWQVRCLPWCWVWYGHLAIKGDSGTVEMEGAATAAGNRLKRSWNLILVSWVELLPLPGMCAHGKGSHLRPSWPPGPPFSPFLPALHLSCKSHAQHHSEVYWAASGWLEE